MRVSRPVGTMYRHDLSQYGPDGKRESYHFKAYPFTHRHVREDVTHLPMIHYQGIDELTKYPIVRDSVLARNGTLLR